MYEKYLHVINVLNKFYDFKDKDNNEFQRSV